MISVGEEFTSLIFANIRSKIWRQHLKKNDKPRKNFAKNVISPSRPDPEDRKLNFYFHTPLQCLQRFYEVPQRSVEIINLS